MHDKMHHITIGYLREDEDIAVLATLNNHDEHLNPEAFLALVASTCATFKLHTGEDIRAWAREDAPDYMYRDPDNLDDWEDVTPEYLKLSKGAGMELKEILEKAKCLIDTPEKWIKNVFARDATGKPVAPEDTTATCFCLMGAYRRAASSSHSALPIGVAYQAIYQAIPSLTKYAKYASLPNFNDSPETTHADVMKILDQTISQLKGTP